MTDPTDQQKSVLLAKAMGWKVPPDTWGDWYFIASDGERITNTNLYDPANMHLAWRVLNWAWQNKTLPTDDSSLWFWWHERNLPNLPPAHAQRLWLDKIFELAVEAGIIKLQE